MALESSAALVFIDNETGEPPSLGSGDQLVVMGAPRLQHDGSYRQLCEVRRLMPVEVAEVAVYDAIEQLRGRVEVAGLSDEQARRNGAGTSKLRAQRLRTAAAVVGAAINDLARAVEAR